MISQNEGLFRIFIHICFIFSKSIKFTQHSFSFILCLKFLIWILVSDKIFVLLIFNFFYPILHLLPLFFVSNELVYEDLGFCFLNLLTTSRQRIILQIQLIIKFIIFWQGYFSTSCRIDILVLFHTYACIIVFPLFAWILKNGVDFEFYILGVRNDGKIQPFPVEYFSVSKLVLAITIKPNFLRIFIASRIDSIARFLFHRRYQNLNIFYSLCLHINILKIYFQRRFLIN